MLTQVLLALLAAEPAEPALCLPTPDRPTADRWSTAAPAPEFYELGPGGAACGERIEARFLHDAERLYLRVTVRLPGGRGLQAVRHERDGNLWGDDTIELFLRPDPAAERVIHFAVNAAGSIADALHTPELTGPAAVAWNPDWQAEVRSTAGAWTAELTVPFATIETKPERGHVWLARIGCVIPGAGHAMWPRNTSQSFHHPAAWAPLVFDDANLLRNPGFEEPTDAQGRAPHWAWSYHEAEGTGKIEVIDGDRPGGGRVAHYEKFDDVMWFPQLWSEPVPIQAGSTYRLHAWVKCAHPFVVRHTFYAGSKVEKHSRPHPPLPDWGEVAVEFSVPLGFSRAAVGFQLSQRSGHLYLDDVSLVRVNDAATVGRGLPDADPIQGLVELSRRRRFKPWDRLKTGGDTVAPAGEYETDRVVFHDTATGATIVKLTRSGGATTRHTYMEMSPWNADGSLLMLFSGQMGKTTWLAPADGSKLHVLPYYASGYQWDRLDPTLLYHRAMVDGKWVVGRRHLDDPELEVLRTFEGEPSIWPMHPDGQRLLVRESFDQEDPPRSVIWQMTRDGRQWLDLHPPHRVHQTWFTKLPDYSVEYEYEGQTPRGQYRILTDGRIEKITDETFGHRAHSPNGQWMAVMGRARIVRIDGAEQRVLADVGTNHQTWAASNDWFAGSSDPHLSRVSVTGRFGYQRLGSHNSSLKHSTYWSEAHPEMSADGTKLAFASNMLHDIEFYWLVMALPQAPTGLTARREEGRVVLAWRRPERATELRGYLVYRSAASGERGELLTPQPLGETTFTDAPPAGAWAYTVTALEHSGLESLPSLEAVVGELPCRYWAEAETGEFSSPAEEAFEPSASGLYAVRLGVSRPADGCAVSLPAGARGEFGVWARLRCPPGAGDRPIASAIALSVDGQEVASGEIAAVEWTWVGGGQVSLAPGAYRVEVKAERPGVLVDQLALWPAAATAPAGALGADRVAPPSPTGLSAAADGAYAVRLSWQPADADDLDHYNVYAASRDAPVSATQACLVGSPAAPTMLDWGLEAGTTYHYLVTAVDRSGNESAPGAPVEVVTERLAARLLAAAEVRVAPEQPDAELTFDAPTDLRCAIWLRVASRTAELRPYRVRLLLDGRRIDDHRINFDYVCKGHGGPLVDAALWDCAIPARNAPASPVGYEVPAGAHTLRLELLDGSPMWLDRVVVTNDLGWLPPGRCDFLVTPIRAEDEPIDPTP